MSLRWLAIGALSLWSVAPAAGPASPFLSHYGTMFVLHGREHRFVGVNAYSLATAWGQNMGCGGPVDPDALFADLPDRSAVRLWAWQGSMATNPSTGLRDWRGLDRVVEAAERHGVLLIMSLTSQGGNCDDGHWKDAAWYGGGYRLRYNADGYAVTTTSYWDYVGEIVGRYAGSPAIAVWEPVNEPEASECAPGYSSWRCFGHAECPDRRVATAALRSFFDAVGKEIKRIDPNHLVGSGVLGTGQCGTAGGDYATVHASRGIDVTSYHDYGAPGEAVPGDAWNGLRARLDQSRALGKPLIVGEVGIEAANGVAGCPGLDRRARQLREKLDGMFGAGVGAVLVWNFMTRPNPGCTFDVSGNDPAFGMLRDHATG